jgi:hypothetical protein
MVPQVSNGCNVYYYNVITSYGDTRVLFVMAGRASWIGTHPSI